MAEIQNHTSIHVKIYTIQVQPLSILCLTIHTLFNHYGCENPETIQTSKKTFHILVMVSDQMC